MFGGQNRDYVRWLGVAVFASWRVFYWYILREHAWFCGFLRDNTVGLSLCGWYMALYNE